MSSIEKKKILLNELLSKQLKNIPLDRKLRYKDLCRVSKYIDTSIFGDDCCIWNGYVTNLKNYSKGTYINFYFRNKKVALHRLLYDNFAENMSSNEYLKFNCSNKGNCCNINHMVKYTYSNSNNINENVNQESSNTTNITDNSTSNIDSNHFSINFD